MIEDEDTPKRPPARLVAPPLHAWSVAELQDYIAELRAEIARAEAAITAKQSHRSSAETFFRPPPGT